VIEIVLAVLLTMTVVMIAAWVFQRAVSNAGWTDVFWTFGTGTTVTLAALAPFEGAGGPTWRQLMVAALVAIWAVRLGSYILSRVRRSAEDARYAQFRREWGDAFQRRLFGVIVVQAPASALLSVSVVLAARNPTPGLRAADLIGAALLVVAIVGEAVADDQMKRFKAGPAGHSGVCDTGLWSWSRHPNYFFEAVGWLAYPVIAVRLSDPWSWASLIAPVLMFALLRFGTGVPPLEAAMLCSKGEAYRRYQSRVSPMFPRPPKERFS
jgi:steroid 5-alpha reductase family enzyme